MLSDILTGNIEELNPATLKFTKLNPPGKLDRNNEETWNILPMDTATFRMWARLMHRRSDDLIEDAMIAATARVHGLRVVTRNVKDFKHFGVSVLNPYVTR